MIMWEQLPTDGCSLKGNTQENMRNTDWRSWPAQGHSLMTDLLMTEAMDQALSEKSHLYSKGFIINLFFFFFVFLGLHLQHMEVSRLRIELEL